jgi:hypothetical protein
VEVERLSWIPADGDAAWQRQSTPLSGAADLVIVFADRAIDIGAALAELRHRFDHAPIVGCSTAGEIHQGAVTDRSAAALALRFQRTRVRAAAASVVGPAGSFDAGAAIAAQLAAPDLRAVLVLSDGLAINGSQLAAGLRQGVGRDVVITGGLAGDGQAFADTWVLWQDEPRRGLVAAVGLYGDAVRVGHGSRGGWSIFGPPRRITRAEGSELFELDGQPALALYKRYLGDLQQALPASALLFPLAIRAQAPDGAWLVRTVLGIDEQAQSLRFAGDVPGGSSAQLMRANIEHLISGAADAAADAARSAAPPGATACIAISCIGRRLVLKGRTDDELDAVLEGLPAGTQQIGLYAYGELAPSEASPCELHNQTMTLLTITETLGAS